MASTKSLYFLAFALSAVVLAVSSSPVVEVNRPDVPVENFNAVQSFGARQPGDFLANTMSFSEAHSPGHVMEFYKYVNVASNQVITQIVAIDQSGKDETEVSIASGGPSHDAAVLKFYTMYGNMAYTVQIYAKNLY